MINIDYWNTVKTSVKSKNKLLEIKYNKEISLGINVYISFLLPIENPGTLYLPPVATTNCLVITAPKQSDVLSRPGRILYFILKYLQVMIYFTS